MSSAQISAYSPLLDAGGGVLIASSNLMFRNHVRHNLGPGFQHVEEALGGAEALVKLETGDCQVLFLDRRLPDLDAEEVTQIIRHKFPAIEVVLVDSDAARPIPAKISERASKIEAHVDALPGMVGQAPSMKKVCRMARLVAGRDTSVLITGPTGSGKELLAQGIHKLSTRATRQFVVVNCAALPETLIESELFGFARGAFTGANQARNGRIEAAQGGTLFLDEIGDVPLTLQPKLLRFLEQRELQRLGSSEVVRVDIRLIAATNADLAALVKEGKFREDLLYRLSVFPLELPPLRQRGEDILPLAECFLRSLVKPGQLPRMDGEFVRILRAHTWPGNVRELQHVMERAVILAEGGPWLRAEHIYFPGSGWVQHSMKGI